MENLATNLRSLQLGPKQQLVHLLERGCLPSTMVHLLGVNTVEGAGHGVERRTRVCRRHLHLPSDLPVRLQRLPLRRAGMPHCAGGLDVSGLRNAFIILKIILLKGLTSPK
jgi:hypothetical protein